jgi:peptidyl-prolyl cis-trans isomerase A (cyclophilin A)
MTRGIRTACAKAALSACLVLVGSACGCGKKLEPAPTPEPAEASKPPKTTAPGNPTDEDIDNAGGDYQVLRAKTATGETASVAVRAPKGWDIVRAPTEPDPHAEKPFTLAEATAGLAKKGTLAAHIETSLGSFYCDLFEEKKPITVANFVGLARGKRKFWDSDAAEWKATPYYDGTAFHRVMPGFMVQGGDRSGTGKGIIGYSFADEIAEGEKHDRGGLLCMASRGKDHNEAQFFITERAAPHIEGSYPIFGQCESIGLVQRIARVPSRGKPTFEPLQKVAIKKVEIRRVVGGASKWMPASAKLAPMPGVVPEGRAVMVGPGGKPVEQSAPHDPEGSGTGVIRVPLPSGSQKK